MEPRRTRNTQKNDELFLYGDLTELIVQSAYTVHSILGTGFLEKVYENALAQELCLRKLKFHKQHSIQVYYKTEIVGEYIADLTK